ncbi:MAG: sugar transferase [Anaerolineae bacterium]|nr:sugar transferase [Anaerolineae bacterium]
MSRRRLPSWPLVKFALDAVLIGLAFLGAYWCRYELQWFRQVEPENWQPFSVYLPMLIILSATLLLLYWLDGAYTVRRGRSWLDEMFSAFRGTLAGIATVIFLVFFAYRSYYSRLIFFYAGVWVVALLGLSRGIERSVQRLLRRRGIGVTRALIVGAGEAGRTVMRNLVARPECGYQVVGFVDDMPERGSTDIGRFKALGGTERIPELVSQYAIDEVIIALPWMAHRKILTIVGQCERQQVRAKIVPDLFQLSLSHVEMDDLNGIPLIGVREPLIRGRNLAFKRLLDVVFSSAALVVLAPFMGAIALLIRLDSPGPVIYKQTRVGRGGRHFTCFKFRTMFVGAEQSLPQLADRNEAKGPLFKIRDDPRRTRVGKLLRRGSIDELPNFWNVLKGDMSIVGPRPALPHEVEQYQPWQRRRLEAAPGITGLWQVNGRSEMDFDEGVLLDIYYVENWSPLLDLKIMLKTVPAILLGRGAY